MGGDTSLTYRISTVAELTGIPRNTLIAWERRYGILHPDRHDNGYRSYTEKDIAILLRLKNALAAGLRISEAVALVRRSDDEAPKDGADRAYPATGSLVLEAVRDELVSSLLQYRRADAELALNRLLPVPFRQRLHRVFFPVLRTIGDLWAAGQISVAQEHYASAILRAHLAAVLLSIGPESTQAPHAACTTFVGDDHEMGALALSIQLSLSGYRVSYLGPNLPGREIVGFWEKQKPSLICVSCILPTPLTELTEYLRELTQIRDARIIVGGNVATVETPAPNIELRHDWMEVFS